MYDIPLGVARVRETVPRKGRMKGRKTLGTYILI
jgi:hypothetical protein